jgi:hypothetical protein
LRHQKSFPSRIKIAPGEALRFLWCFFVVWGVNSPEKERSDFLVRGISRKTKSEYSLTRVLRLEIGQYSYFWPDFR